MSRLYSGDSGAMAFMTLLTMASTKGEKVKCWRTGDLMSLSTMSMGA